MARLAERQRIYADGETFRMSELGLAGLVSAVNRGGE